MKKNINEILKDSSFANRCYTIAISTAVLSALAACIILVLIFANNIKTSSLLKQQENELAKLRKQANIKSGDKDILSQIRRLDLQYRQDMFSSLNFNRKGSFLFLGSVVIMLIGLKLTNTIRKYLPSPEPAVDSLKEQIRQAKYSRLALISGSVIIAFGGLILYQSAPVNFTGTGTTISVFPPAEQLRNWPRFRGAYGNGIVSDTNVPLKWDGKTRQGIVWKKEIPLPGKNSPVVWNDRIFLSGADPNRQHIYCFDAATGNILWTGDVNVPTLKPNQKPLKLGEDVTYAPSTMATDGQRVYAIFPTGMVGSLDFAGRKVWEKDLGRPDSMYGYACSLAMFENLLLVQFDQGKEEEPKSEMMAIDGSTGNFVWRKKRPVGSSWATPIVINHQGKSQLLTLGNPWVIAYNPADGTELWRAKCLSGDIAASPIYANGLVFVIEPDKKLIAIRPDGKGDVTNTHIAWSIEVTTPSIASPVGNGKFVFLLMGDLNLGCFNASDGTELWHKDMGKFFQASPSLAGDKIYLLNEKGEMFIVEAGTEYKELAKNQLGEDCFASPAFVNGHIYIRSDKYLFCIGE
jgi:outer membrane protein assembly factor BamB